MKNYQRRPRGVKHEETTRLNLEKKSVTRMIDYNDFGDIGVHFNHIYKHKLPDRIHLLLKTL